MTQKLHVDLITLRSDLKGMNENENEIDFIDLDP
jgi:hypothetical protein